MRSLVDAAHVLDGGLAAIRSQYQVPGAFAEAVEQAAAAAARRLPQAHVDRTDLPFVTLDPASSTDLDQAFAIERRSGGASAPDGDLLLHYAIADVGWFVRPGDALDTQAWKRGATLYMPDGKAPLYPAALADGAASLLPDVDRAAVVFQVSLSPEGGATLEGAERAVIRSRAKLAYTTVTVEQLPGEFGEFVRRVAAAEVQRGAARVESPEQVVERDDGRFRLSFRPRLESERDNAALSLATNLAVAAAMHAAGVGLFRVMPAPDERAVRRLRHTARALQLRWPEGESLEQFTRTLAAADPAQAAFMLAVRRAGGRAEYRLHEPGVEPWHAAMAAPYAHATAPLRRLADRYVVETALSIASGSAVPEHVVTALAQLPDVMARADRLGNTIDREVADLAEAVMLHGREGEIFDAVVIDEDEDGARIQLCSPAVLARVAARRVSPGDQIRVKLLSADPAARRVQFVRVG